MTGATDLSGFCRPLQLGLIERRKRLYPDVQLSSAAAAAFLETPRHRFVTRFKTRPSGPWNHVDDRSVIPLLPMLYDDRSLIIKERAGKVLSTISQPSLVLLMLDLASPFPGTNVLEVGTGSGWNAAMLAHMVTRSGTVTSFDIYDDLLRAARSRLDCLGVDNVELVQVRSSWIRRRGLFDSVVYTAAARAPAADLSDWLTPEARVLIVLRDIGLGDALALLHRRGHVYESSFLMNCSFLPMRERGGPLSLGDSRGIVLANATPATTRCITGGDEDGSSAWLTSGFVHFLLLSLPLLCAARESTVPTVSPGEHFVLRASDDEYVMIDEKQWHASQDGPLARMVSDAFDQWRCEGNPDLSHFKLHVAPAGSPSDRATAYRWRERRGRWVLSWDLAPPNRTGAH